MFGDRPHGLASLCGANLACIEKSDDLRYDTSSGQTIGTISLKAVSEQRSAIKWVLCGRSPTRACIFARAIELANTHVESLTGVAETQSNLA